MRDAFPQPPPRVLGRVDGPSRGPLLVLVGGIHGNEPGGIEAARRVLASLGERQVLRGGALVALTGNRVALERGDRLVDEDLNRVWTEERLARPLGPDSPSEAREASELLAILDQLLAEDSTGVHLLDLHSTSAGGSPFAIVADTIQNRRLARALHVPVLLGLEERVEGTLLAWFSERGHVALCFEGGKNRLPETVDHHEAAVWAALVELGMVVPEDVPAHGVPEPAPGAVPIRERLAHAAGHLPHFIEVDYRQGIAPGEVFTMRDGHRNFDRVTRGQVLADRVPAPEAGPEPVAAPFAGYLLMPRYQGQGDDGFFLGRRVAPVWLVLSTVLRRLRLGGLLRFLPGVRTEPGRPDVLLADPRVARWLLVDLFHLFGFRRALPRSGCEVFVRRPDRF